MHVSHRVAAFFFFAVSFAAPLCAQESVELPAYAPAPGDHMFRTEVQTSDESRGVDKRPKTSIYGVFDRKMTILSRGAEAIDVRWLLDADVPADAPASPDGAYAFNDRMSWTLNLYGLHALRFEAAPNGEPTRIPDWSALRQAIHGRVEGMLAGPDSDQKAFVRETLKTFDANPTMLVTTLVPEAAQLAQAQLAKSRRVAVGEGWTVDRLDAINNVPVPVRTRWTLESVDHTALTATLVFDEARDAAALKDAYASLLRNQLEAATQQNGFASTVFLVELSSAASTTTGRAVLSLRDGSTIAMEGTNRARIGGYRAETTFKVTKTN